MKRIIDVCLALVGLVVAAPLMGLIAVAIKLDSTGKVIFSQSRLGQYGRVFQIHKFRKFPDTWGDKGVGVTVAGDVRMTRLGRLLERTKLDELPQLWNILRGEMSFVGPRPESLRYKNLFKGEHARVLDFKPGIFGPSQVAFRNESEMYPPERDPEEFYREVLFPKKARGDIDYFSRSNVIGDLVWMVRGVWYSVAGVVNWGRLLRQRGIHLAHDFLVVQVAWLLANLIRFDGLPDGYHLDAWLTGVWLTPLVVIPVMALAGCYRQPVRHFSFGAAVRLGTANTVGWTFAYLVLLGLFHRNASILLAPLAVLLATPMLVLPRLIYRNLWRKRKRNVNGNGNRYIKLAVYGVGRRGAAMARLIDQGFPDVEVVGFLDDDDHELRGREVCGCKVLGSERDLNNIHAVHRFDQLWLAFVPEFHKYRRLRRWCNENKVKMVVLPQESPFRTLCAAESGPAPKGVVGGSVDVAGEVSGVGEG